MHGTTKIKHIFTKCVFGRKESLAVYSQRISRKRRKATKYKNTLSVFFCLLLVNRSDLKNVRTGIMKSMVGWGVADNYPKLDSS